MGGLDAEVQALGARLVMVGNGSPAHALDFQATQGLRVPLYVDPGLRVYQAFDFASGLASTLNLKAVGHALRAWQGGHRQGALQGHPFQQGGLALVLPDGQVPYLHRSAEAGDLPEAQALLAALRAALPVAGVAKHEAG